MVNELTWEKNDNDNELCCVAIITQCGAQWCMWLLLHNIVVTHYYTLLPLDTTCYYALLLLHLIIATRL
jgi:hypothetical protein